ncbi:MAG: hypothetical protein ACREMF_05240 [Gemmatimonadales bacterium]
MHRTRTHLTLGLALATAVACSDRPQPTAVVVDRPEATVATPPGGSPRRPDRLAYLFARALRSPAFRAYLKAQLDASPYPENKIQLQGFLPANGRRALRHLAEESGTSDAEVSREAAAGIRLEVYLPVPSHRAAWTGDENVLVATALQDREAPVAFDPAGRRRVLDSSSPPAIPVIAIVPEETNFANPPARVDCLVNCGGGGGGGGTSNPAGLYLTRTHFDDDYESWLKGKPEYEIHILGQLGTTDSLTDYQCAGADAGGPYAFDQNNRDWSGNVLLFSQTQINTYKAAHPGQAMRVFALEDDDTPCGLRVNKDDFNRLIRIVDSIYNRRTGGRDTTISVAKYWRAANVARNIIALIASIIRTNDDLIGNGVEDAIVGSFAPGFNWFVKGQNNITTGYLNLVMR